MSADGPEPAQTPAPPYYAVIFTTLQPELSSEEVDAYAATAATMEMIATTIISSMSVTPR